MASVYGTKLKLSVFGESHGAAIGCVIDGFPAGMKIDDDAIAAFMKRRAPGGQFSTKRTEPDIPRILSGVSDGYTNGYPISVVIENTNQRSSAYADKMTVPRPSHADYAAAVKYGDHVELHGGGHFSGRLTAPLVFAGALCSQYLAMSGIEIAAHIKQMLNVSDHAFAPNVTAEELRELKTHAFPTLDFMAAEAFATIIGSARDKGDSVGAKLECAAVGLPPALGEHMFESVEAEISQLMFAIPAVKGIEFGAGFDFCRMYGSDANDAYEYRDGKVVTRSNNCGGIVGGMTTGMPVIFSLALKPTPSIYSEQQTVDLEKKCNTTHTIKGRHDPCIAVRAVPVVEACTAIALTSLMLKADGRKL
ncbi:MAG: chorismate synthase [Ruminococcaceae bacterium]|nr:chorismate synthase [Oscillospiraceae bacterium]